MNFKFLVSCLFVSMVQIVVAFAPKTLKTHTSVGFSLTLPSNKPAQLLSPTVGVPSVQHLSSRETASSTVLFAGDNPFVQADLFVGMFAVMCGTTPYALQIVFKDLFNNLMFAGIYTDTTEGREAEIGFKTRFATLALLLTLLTFVDIYFYPERTFDVVLKQQYVVWAIFYTDATLKIRREALSDPPVFAKDSRLFIQIWHIFVAALLWADVSESVTGNAIEQAIRGLIGADLIA